VATERAAGREVIRFAVVGAVNVGVDVAVFNVVLLALDPLAAKAVATSVAITSSFFMNRHWTWADRPRTSAARQYALFFVLSGVGLIIAEACLFVSHYVLGLRSVLADNASANVVGMALAMVFRFWAYRRYVFPDTDPPTATGEAAATRT
jgi:putative flippase GtrA